MICTVNIGNTETDVGFFENDTLAFSFRISSDKSKTSDEYVATFKNIIAAYGKTGLEKTIKGAIISSVVPKLVFVISESLYSLFCTKPLIVGPGVKTGLDIKIDNHTQLGADIVANTVFASTKLCRPFAVIHLGTATTVTAVNSSGELCGVFIAPGVQISLDALSCSAAELPHISLCKPKGFIGKNTVDSMTAGSVYGTAMMLDAVLDRLCHEFSVKEISAVACGQYAKYILSCCTHKIEYNVNLTLEGLNTLYKLNTRKPKQL